MRVKKVAAQLFLLYNSVRDGEQDVMLFAMRPCLHYDCMLKEGKL